jgi:phage/plasmid-like protein (TIGR03299 family)
VDERGNTIEAESRFATIYTNPVTNENQYLGVVGSYYEPIQNEKHIDLLDALVDESGAHFDTAGSLRSGRETFVSMKLPETMNVGGQDPVDLYLLALNSHDGASAFRFLVTPVRVVCANTQAAAIRSAKSSFSIRHVRGATGVIAEAREALELTFKYVSEFELEAERLIGMKFSNAEFDEYAKALFEFDKAETTRQFNTVTEHVEGVTSLWSSSATMAGITGTRWGAYQAVTEYTDHFMSVRNTGYDENILRANRTALSGSVTRLKEKAFAALV